MIRSIEFRAMNTTIMLAADGQHAIAGMYAAKAFIDECEQRFSRFLPASEISELNRHAGAWSPVSADLMDMLQLSLLFHHETQGLFDPSILPDLKQMGYDRSLDEIRATRAVPPTPASTRTSRPAFHEISLDRPGNLVYLPRGMELDLGGIAKAWIVEKAAHLLKEYSELCAVSAGGDILFIGHPLDGMDWDVYLEDPRDSIQVLAQLHIPSGAVATSSVMKRSWTQDGKVRHHLIDPRTGESANTDWLSVTVFAPDILTAEVYAKAFLIGGESELPNLLKSEKGLTYIAVDPHGNLLGSPNYKDYVYEFTADTVIPVGIAQ